jgi:hypothetical protein
VTVLAGAPKTSGDVDTNGRRPLLLPSGHRQIERHDLDRCSRGDAPQHGLFERFHARISGRPNFIEGGYQPFFCLV